MTLETIAAGRQRRCHWIRPGAEVWSEAGCNPAARPPATLGRWLTPPGLPPRGGWLTSRPACRRGRRLAHAAPVLCAPYFAVSRRISRCSAPRSAAKKLERKMTCNCKTRGINELQGVIWKAAFSTASGYNHRMRATMAFLLSFLLTVSAFPAAADVSPERYLAHIKVLASDQMKGRANGQPELQQAAKYIAEQFRACGLQPVNGSYFQKFRATTGTSVGPNNRLTAVFGDGPRSYKSGSDFVPLGISDPGSASGPVVFAGYGITADEYRYDDYAHLDVKGKIVLVLRHEPQEMDDKSVFSAREYTSHSGIVEKAINARMHGAAALVLVNDPNPHDGDDDLLKLDALMGPERLGLSAIQVKRKVAEALLASAGKNLKELQAAIDRNLSNQSVALPVRLEMAVDVARRTNELENVVGLLPGNDPALSGEALVIGAHYDHLGLGGRSSLAPRTTGKVHHGADDNASGTAGVLELACDLAGQPGQRKRGVLFLAFAGEELGLLGSGYYTRNPLLPIEKTVAMINLDMIGRPKERKIYVGGVGTAPEFRSLLEEENQSVGLKLEYSLGGYGSSDHTSFTARQVPVLFFFSGLHSDYHKPSDTWEKINPAGAAEVLRLVQRVALRLNGQPQRPLFVRVAAPGAPAGSGGGGGYGPYFGSIPDFGEVENGVRFADVREGSPAALAGLRRGDILVEFDGKPVKNLYDFTYLLRAHKPGDEVMVVVLRNNERVTARVKLARRPT